MQAEQLDDQLKARIETELQSAPAILFMKGDRVFPQCGFSGQVVQILDHLGLDYKTFDILADEEVRQGLKLYSKWPTYPQLYVKGELVGGCDILTDMFQSGDLAKLLKEKGVLEA